MRRSRSPRAKNHLPAPPWNHVRDASGAASASTVVDRPAVLELRIRAQQQHLETLATGDLPARYDHEAARTLVQRE
jgi:hypothetical protein